MIRTPDQRIRVFVSSTLRELADERRAVRAAIERHAAGPGDVRARRPPASAAGRSTAPTSRRATCSSASTAPATAGSPPTRRSPGSRTNTTSRPATMPKLIYIKATDTRDERLTHLIARIQADDTAAYLPFHICRRPGRPGRRRPRNAPRRTIRRIAGHGERRSSRRALPRSSPACRCRTRRRSAASATSRRCATLLEHAARTEW